MKKKPQISRMNTLPCQYYMDADGGGAEFINHYFMKRCKEHGITFTRGRAHHSNDNCFVEQKNGDVVRKTVGYFCFEGDDSV